MEAAASVPVGGSPHSYRALVAVEHGLLAAPLEEPSCCHQAGAWEAVVTQAELGSHLGEVGR